MSNYEDFKKVLISVGDLSSGPNPSDKPVHHASGIWKDMPSEQLNSGLLDKLLHSRHFYIEDDIKKLLILTNPPPDLDDKLLRLPFNEIFFDVHFTKADGIDDDEIHGLLVYNPGDAIGPILLKDSTRAYTGTADNEFINLWYGASVSELHNPDNEGVRTWVNSHVWVYDNNYKGKVEVFRDCHQQHNLFRRFITNFLLLLNQRDIRLVELFRRETVRTRRDVGPYAYRKFIRVELTGELKRYVNALKQKGLFSGNYTHRFWVRGHYRNLSSEHFTLRRGDRIWIMPFIKGSGILVPKTYHPVESANPTYPIKHEP